MGDHSHIQWTDATWNPVTGCSKVSQGCKNCYALRDWARLSAPRQTPNAYTGREFTDVRAHDNRLDQPLRWSKPRRVFVNSMSDLFHESVPDEFINDVFAVMALAPRHTFQILTKRPDRMRRYMTACHGNGSFRRDDIVKGRAWTMLGQLPKYEHEAIMQRPWPLPNVWLGVSVEDQETADERIPLLLQTPAAVRFVSYEPALGPVDFRFTNGLVHGCDAADYLLDWIIVGGESGPRARTCDIHWIRSAIEQCKLAGVACFVKQLGASPLSDNMFDFPATWAPDMSEPVALELSDRKGGDSAEWPEDLRVRQFPGEKR